MFSKFIKLKSKTTSYFMNKLIFATNNIHKLQEIREMLSFCYSVLSLKDVDLDIDIAETGNTFKENAVIKAEVVFKITNENCFADDSGLCVDALDGGPGVWSARYAGEPSNDGRNRKKILQELDGKERREAAFYTVICLMMNGEPYFFEGKVSGKITTEEKGNNGFGYDPVFIPEGYDKTFAEMNAEEKNAISHRAIAVKKMVDFLVPLKQ